MTRLNPARVALLAAVTAAAGWTAKSVAIGIAGGLDLSPLEGPLFLFGLAACLTAMAALGVALTRERPLWLRIAAGVLAPVLGLLAALLVDGVVGAVRGPAEGRHWVWMEVNLWVTGLAVLGLAWRADVRRAEAYT